MPGDRPDERTEEERDQIHRLEPVPHGAIRPGVDPGERNAQEGGQQGGSRTNEEGVEEGSGDDVTLEHLPVVLQAPLRAKAQIIQHEKASHHQGDERGHHQGRNEDADDGGGQILSLEEGSKVTPVIPWNGLRLGYDSHEIPSSERL